MGKSSPTANRLRGCVMGWVSSRNGAEGAGGSPPRRDNDAIVMR